jgi:hypothetical protein
MATFADDTAINVIGETFENRRKLQSTVNKKRKWRINLSESKSAHIELTNR